MGPPTRRVMQAIVAIQSIATLAIFINMFVRTCAGGAAACDCKTFPNGEVFGDICIYRNGACYKKYTSGECASSATICSAQPRAGQQQESNKAGLCGYGLYVFGACGIYLNFMCLRLAIVLKNGFSSSEKALARWVNISVEAEEFASPEKCKGCHTNMCGIGWIGYEHVWDRTINSARLRIRRRQTDKDKVDCVSCVQQEGCCNCMFGLCCLSLQRVCYACENTKYVKKRIRGGPLEYVASSRSEFEYVGPARAAQSQNPDSIWSPAKAARMARARAGAQRSAVSATIVCNPMAGRSNSSTSMASRDIRTRSLSMHGDSSGESKNVVEGEREAEEKRAREEAEAAARYGE